MGFGLGFEKGVSEGIPLGVKSFLTSKKIKADTQAELEKQRQKLIEKNQQTTAMGNLLEVDTKTNQLTNEVELDVPEEFEFKSPTDAQRLSFLPDVGNEFQEVLRQLEREDQPKDFFVNKKSEMDKETKQGIVTAIDKNPESPTFGNRIKIGDDPNYKFRKDDETIIEGVIDINGEKVGQKGKRTKITTFENGTFDIMQVGNIKGDGTDKPVEKVLFESNLAEIGVDKAKAIDLRNKYIQKGINKKGFGDDQQREAFREGINDKLNKVAWDYAKLGSAEAQIRITEIFYEGQAVVNKQAGGLPNVDRTSFFNQQLADATEQYGRGEWSFEDFTAIVQFLRAKYENYIKSEDPVRDEDELMFELPELR